MTVAHEPLRRGVIKTLNVGSFRQSGAMRAEQATFCMYSEASFHIEACPPRQHCDFDCMSERTLLSPESDIMRVSALHMICSSLKQDT